MKQRESSQKLVARSVAGLAALSAMLLCLCLLASPASAAFEQIGCFAGGPSQSEACKPVAEEKFTEEVQLGGVGGMAVNYTGAGGVPAGTVYAVGNTLTTYRAVSMYGPSKGGEGLEFLQSWEVLEAEKPYSRCGPLLGVNGEGKVEHPCERRVGALAKSYDVDIDETTGNVYVYNGTFEPGRKAIIEYSPDGSEEITRFGEIAPLGKTTAETPAQIHESPFPGALAVNAAGEVYVFDLNGSDNFYHRLMKFKPKTPGKYDEYEYAGTTEDVAAGFGGLQPIQPVADAAGNLYVTLNLSEIAELDPSQPKAPPLCKYKYGPGGITGITVNPLSGEAFFNSYKPPKRVRRLGPCDEATGEFTELAPEPEALEIKPERDDLYALAFDPLRQVDPARPAGVLYGGAPNLSPQLGPGEPGQSSLGYIFAHPEELPPVIESQSATHVSSSGALLRASINPSGFATHYRFQYLSAAQYEANPPEEPFAGAIEAPLGGADLPGSPISNPVSASIDGLAAGTEYRFRVVATSFCSKEKEEAEEACETAGEAASFRTFPVQAPGLPDDRAWELVSPPQKNGGEVFPAYPLINTCGGSCKPGLQGSGRFPMQSSSTGDTVSYEGLPFAPGEGGNRENAYIARRDPLKGWQTLNPTPLLSASGGGKGYKAYSADFSRGLLEQTNPQLSPEAPSGYANLYAQPIAEPLALEPLVKTESHRPTNGLNFKYAGASSDLSRVFFAANDSLTEGTPFAPEASDGGASKFNLYEWHEGTLALVNVLPGNTETEAGASFGAGSANSISADGARAYWSDEAGHVYLREDGHLTKAIPDPGKFLAASTDGSKILLTNGHVYDTQEETTTDLTDGKGGFQGIAGQSDDLSHVYFVDTEVLDEAPNGEGEKAVAGKFNLYAWGEGGSPHFIARLAAKDNLNSNEATWGPLPSKRSAEASPQGRYLAFLSQARLTDFDNTGACEVIQSGPTLYGPGPCPEAFLYDSATDELVCASCNPTDTRPLGQSFLRLIESAGEWLPQPRYLTDEGRLYFDSRDSLSPFDTNEGVEDVYRYEPQAGPEEPEGDTCERQGGCIDLISAGHEAADSNLLAVDQTGKNVFFTTRDRLAQKDKDDLIDLYDAREDGGIPAETEVARGECQGEACVAALSPPNDPTPGSSSFDGPGNVEEKKASKKHKRKKKHAKKKGHKRSHGRAANHNRGGVK
jgi:hypothetical protein